MPGGNPSTRRKPEYPEKTRVSGENPSARRKPENPGKTLEIRLRSTETQHMYETFVVEVSQGGVIDDY